MLHTICTHARTCTGRQAGRQTHTIRHGHGHRYRHDKTRTRTICTDTRVRMMAGAFDLMCVDVPEEPMVTIVNTVS